jgi:hypothetical protein
VLATARHIAYAAGWKKFEPLWDLAIRAKRVTAMLPVLERVLTGFGSTNGFVVDDAGAEPLPPTDSPAFPVDATSTPIALSTRRPLTT